MSSKEEGDRRHTGSEYICWSTCVSSGEAVRPETRATGIASLRSRSLQPLLTGSITELIYIMDSWIRRPTCAPPDRRGRPRSIFPHPEPISPRCKMRVQWDITLVFPVDRFRVAPWKPSRMPADPAAKPVPHGACDRRLPPTQSLQCRCINRVAAQEEVQMDVATTFGGHRCTVVFQKSSKTPGNSSKKARGKKKNSRFGPLSRQKARQNAVSGVQNRPKMHRKGPKPAANGSELACPGCGTGCDGWVFGVSFRDRSKGTQLSRVFERLTRTHGRDTCLLSPVSCPLIMMTSCRPPPPVRSPSCRRKPLIA